MPKIICPGLSRTGSRSLARALQQLGFTFVHWAPNRLRDVILGLTPNPDFRRYDDVHAVLDLPASLFYRELLDAYPGSRVILTVRDEGEWFASVRQHYDWVHENLNGTDLEEAALTQMMAYGSHRANEFVYRKKYREHNEAVQRLPNVLVMDVTKGDGWEKLCPFLGRPVPAAPFPHLRVNRKPGERPAG